MLPILTVLFLISYGLMTMLIVEQGATIESQRALIKELFRDSNELAAVKERAQQERKLADAQTQAAQNPSVKTPSTQAAPQRRVPSKTEKIQTPQFQAPSRPASDQAENRRAVIAI